MKIKLLLISSLLFTCIVKGQQASSTDLPTIIGPSPTVAGLMKFEEVPVNEYTGQPNISIPFFAKQLGFGLGMDISLSYSTQGVKVNDDAGWTGTGWNLNAGGTIARTVRGIPDERIHTSALPGVGVFHNPDFWNFPSLNPLAKGEFIWKANGEPTGKFDYELDLYQFNVLGYTGRFVIIKEAGVLVAKQMDLDSNLKISIDYNISTFEIYSFTILDNQNNNFLFDVKEISTYNTVSATEQINNTQNVSQSGPYTISSAWHVSKISNNALGLNETILASFQYESHYEQSISPRSTTTNRLVNASAADSNDLVTVSYNSSVLPPKLQIAFSSSTTISKKVKHIFLKDASRISFEINQNIQNPGSSGVLLEKVKMETLDANGYQIVKSYSLNYEALNKRAWLNEIEEFGINSNSNGKTILTYNNKQMLPEKNGNLTPSAIFVDDWGYFTGNTVLGCGIPFKDTSLVTTGLLTSIIYPTGGIKEFQFEANTITYQGQNTVSDEIYKNYNIDNWYPTTLDMTFNSGNNSNSYLLNLTEDTTLYYKLNSTTASTSQKEDSAIRFIKNNSTSYTIPLVRTEESFKLPAGSYTISLLNLTTGTNFNVNACLSRKSFYSTIKRFVYGGGVRIKSIAFKDEISTINYAKKIDYEYSDPNDSTKSSGGIDAIITGLTRSYTQQIERYLLTEECGFLTERQFSFETLTDTPIINLTKGNYVGYKYVKKFEDNLGYTISEYSSTQDYFSPIQNFFYPYIPFDDIDYKRGLLLKSEVFDLSNTKLSVVSNVYEFTENIIAPTYNLGTIDNKFKSFFNFYNSWISAIPNNPMTYCVPSCGSDCLLGQYGPTDRPVPFYFTENSVKSTRARISSSTKKEFFANNTSGFNSVETSSYQSFNPVNHQLSESTMLDSKGQSSKSKIYYTQGSTYPPNIFTGPELQTINQMNNSNMVSTPVLQETYVNNLLTSRVKSVYSEFTPNQFLLKEVQTSKGNNPLEKRLEYKKYDIAGNIQEVMQADGTPITYLWGHNQTLPIAKIEGLSFSQVAAKLNITPAALENYNESNLVAIDALRNAFSVEDPFMLTTYTYEVGIGIKTMRDPRGRVTTYHYDDFQRLEKVTDHEGNLVGKNEYKYATQN